MQKGFAPILVLVGIVVLAAIVAGIYLKLANSDFENCKKMSGSRILEIYPPGCQTPDGKIFHEKDWRTPLLLMKRSEPISQTPQVTPLSSPSVDETANWKTYTDDQDRYAFKYPQNLNLKMPIPPVTENTVVFTFEENTINLTVNQLKLAVTSYSDGQTLEQIINKIQLAIQAAGQKFRPKEVNLAGNKAYRYENIIEGNSSSSITTSVSHKNIVYQITLFNATNENKFLYDQILSTFKFTN